VLTLIGKSASYSTSLLWQEAPWIEVASLLYFENIINFFPLLFV